MDRSNLKSVLTLSESIIAFSVPSSGDLQQLELTSFPIYGSIVHLVQQWIEKTNGLSLPLRQQVQSLLPKEFVQASKQDISQNKDVVAKFVTHDLALLVPALKKMYLGIPVVEQVEE